MYIWRCLKQTYTLMSAICTVTTRYGNEIFILRLKLSKEFAIVMVLKTQPACPKQTVSPTCRRSWECLKISRRFSQKYGEHQVDLILLNTLKLIILWYCFTLKILLPKDVPPQLSYQRKNVHIVGTPTLWNHVPFSRLTVLISTITH